LVGAGGGGGSAFHPFGQAMVPYSARLQVAGDSHAWPIVLHDLIHLVKVISKSIVLLRLEFVDVLIKIFLDAFKKIMRMEVDKILTVIVDHRKGCGQPHVVNDFASSHAIT
jgi:hypothetical protein